MSKRSFAPLGETELELLQIMWNLKKGTVSDVHKKVLEYRNVAYTTVMNIMKKLADKGYLDYTKKGQAYEYFVNKPADEVRSRILDDIIEKVFKGSPISLVQHLVEKEKLTDQQLRIIMSLIDELKEDSEI